jgi:hypothetical protein
MKKYVIRWAKTNDFIKDEYLEKGTTKDPSKALILTKLPEDLGEGDDTGIYEFDSRQNAYISFSGAVSLRPADYESEKKRYSEVLKKGDRKRGASLRTRGWR